MVPAGEPGHGADVPDDCRGDDRAAPEQPGQTGPAGPDAAVSLLLVSRIRASMRRRSSTSSAASSRRAASTADADAIAPTMRAAWPAVSLLRTPRTAR